MHEIDGRDFAKFLGRHEEVMAGLIETSAQMQLNDEAARVDANLSQRKKPPACRPYGRCSAPDLPI